MTITTADAITGETNDQVVSLQRNGWGMVYGGYLETGTSKRASTRIDPGFQKLGLVPGG